MLSAFDAQRPAQEQAALTYSDGLEVFYRQPSGYEFAGNGKSGRKAGRAVHGCP
jgi:hypothetical protein